MLSCSLVSHIKDQSSINFQISLLIPYLVLGSSGSKPAYMEYRDFHLHQHQLQEQYAGHYKPSFTCEAWNSSYLCDGYGSTFTTENSQSTEMNTRDKGKEYDLDYSQRSSRDDDMLMKEDEASDNYLPRLSEMISSRLSGSSANDSSLVSSITAHSHVTGKEIWPAGITLNSKTTSYNTLGAATSSSSSDLSTLEMPPSLLLSCSLGLTSQMLLGGSSCGGLHLSDDSFGLDNMQQRENSPSNSSNKISEFVRGSGVGGRAKTSRSWSQAKEYGGRAKKSRASCPTLKVTKEKLGDRIQNLQRLVAPFGQTNTASVLNETIGYIHFLHDQLQALSIPYMKSWKNKPLGTVQLDYCREENRREWKPELRSRGLCLVPLSCASFFHNLD